MPQNKEKIGRSSEFFSPLILPWRQAQSRSTRPWQKGHHRQARLHTSPEAKSVLAGERQGREADIPTVWSEDEDEWSQGRGECHKFGRERDAQESNPTSCV